MNITGCVAKTSSLYNVTNTHICRRHISDANTATHLLVTCMSTMVAKKVNCAVKCVIPCFSQTAFEKKAKPSTGAHTAVELFTAGNQLIPILFSSVEIKRVFATSLTSINSTNMKKYSKKPVWAVNSNCAINTANIILHRQNSGLFVPETPHGRLTIFIIPIILSAWFLPIVSHTASVREWPNRYFGMFTTSPSLTKQFWTIFKTLLFLPGTLSKNTRV